MMKPSKKQLYAVSAFGAISGALALYLVKRPNLRKQLAKSENTTEALKAFTTHVQHDSNDFLKFLRDFAEDHIPHGAKRKAIETKAKREAVQTGKKALNEAKKMERQAEQVAEEKLDEAAIAS